MGIAIIKLVSGGQTGVDRAALDAAMELGVLCGGWCPKGRVAEDGKIPDRFPLRETPSPDYEERTEWNVRDSDGTLVVTDLPVTGGTAYTIEAARRLGKPRLVIELKEGEGNPESEEELVGAIRAWIQSESIEVLNIAGPRQSKTPWIAARAARLLRLLLSE